MEKYTEFIEKCMAEQQGNTRFIAALTDEYIVENASNLKASLTGKEEKVLEIRVFNEKREYKLFRPQVEVDFSERVCEDTGEFFDEIQYLDIDTSKSSPGNVIYSTGGGKYNLPLQKIKDAKVRIRYYLDQYNETGQARVCDWRIVELTE